MRRPARLGPDGAPGGLVADGDAERHLTDGLTLLAAVEEGEVGDVDDGEDDPDHDAGWPPSGTGRCRRKRPDRTKMAVTMLFGTPRMMPVDDDGDQPLPPLGQGPAEAIDRADGVPVGRGGRERGGGGGARKTPPQAGGRTAGRPGPPAGGRRWAGAVLAGGRCRGRRPAGGDPGPGERPNRADDPSPSGGGV